MTPHVRDQSGTAHWVSIALASLAVILALKPLEFDSPVSSPVSVPAEVTDPTPVRHPSPEPLYRLGAFTYRCSECHRAVPVAHAAGHELTNHMGIHLAHGINSRCLNCHHAVNREAFVDDYGEEIPWDQPQLLCARCHGPVYRDWQHGSHGRINGYWDTSRGEQVRLKCVRCHDPHQPPFAPLPSAPGPHTLRVTPHSGDDHTNEPNPLRVTDNDSSSSQMSRSLQGMNHE